MEAHTSDTNKTNETSEETTAPAPPGDPEAAATAPGGGPAAPRGRARSGRLEGVYSDEGTDEPQFGTVKEGFIGRHLTFVPLTGIKISPDELQVTVTREQIKSAPNIEQHGEELS